MRLANAPFPLGLSGLRQLPQTRTALVNCWNDEGAIISRPGISLISETDLVARGQFRYNDTLYRVLTDKLVKVTNLTTGAYTEVGTIEGVGDIDHAIGFNHAVIIDKGGKGYTLTPLDVLTEITDPDFTECVSVTHIDGRFVYIPANGDPAIFSDVGNGASIQATSFFDAEALPDKNTVCFDLRGTLFIGGTDSFELFRNTSAATVPFSRLQGGRIDYGYIGGLLYYADTYVFIGRARDQQIGIYAIAQGTAKKLSNAYIDEILSTYTMDDLADATAARFKWVGYDIATFRLKNHSFGFYMGEWFELSTFSDGEPDLWQAKFITYHDQDYYCAYSGKFGRISNAHTDYGLPVIRSMDIGLPGPDGLDFTAQSVEIQLSQGYDVSGTVGLQVSRDNVNYSEPFYRNVGAAGVYNHKVEWSYPGGLGYFQGFMGLRISTTSAVNFSATGLMIR